METQLSLLYDEDCPLCRWYTAKFVQYGFLNPEGRISYSTHIDRLKQVVDPELAQNKIACIDHRTNQVSYGIDSLLLILGQRFKLIPIIGRFKPVNYLLRLLYQLITYNRKIVAPAPKQAIACACEPSRSILWRFLFIALITCITSRIIHWYFPLFFSGYLNATPVSDWMLLILQLGFQSICFWFFKQKNLYDYLGHLAFVSFLGSLLLWGFGLLIQVCSIPGIPTALLSAVSFGIVLCFMFYEHKRRVQLKDWSLRLCLSWIVFRILIYPLVFQL